MVARSRLWIKKFELILGPVNQSYSMLQFTLKRNSVGATPYPLLSRYEDASATPLVGITTYQK